MVPAASLLPIPGNGMATWTELGKSVFAVGKNGITVHYGELRGDRNVDRAREIRRLMENLQSRKLVTPQSALHLWDQSGPDLFKEILPNRVYAGNRAAPTNFQASIGMRPDHYRKNEVQKRHRTRKLFRKCAVGFAIATAALLVAGTYRMAYSQIRVQKEYIEKLQPETVRIDRIRSQWAEMAPAVDRNASVLEVWRKIFTLPSSSHVRISRMKIGMDAIELVCETESGVKALRFIDEMSRSDSLSHFTWNYTTPEEYADGTSRFELKGFRL
jgi:hypothetical protein